MNIFFDEHIEILRALAEFNVEYMLVGGYAVVHYGHKRTTGDLDLWIKPTDENKVKLVECLRSLRFEEESLAQISASDFTKPTVFSFGSPPLKIDFITDINQPKWEEASPYLEVFEWEGVGIKIIQLKHLLINKMLTGRMKDKMDVEELQKLNPDIEQ